MNKVFTAWRTENANKTIKSARSLDRAVRPNHDVYLQPRTEKEAAVPRHNEINEYTAKAILKKLS